MIKTPLHSVFVIQYWGFKGRIISNEIFKKTQFMIDITKINKF